MIVTKPMPSRMMTIGLQMPFPNRYRRKRKRHPRRRVRVPMTSRIGLMTLFLRNKRPVAVKTIHPIGSTMHLKAPPPLILKNLLRKISAPALLLNMTFPIGLTIRLTIHKIIPPHPNRHQPQIPPQPTSMSPTGSPRPLTNQEPLQHLRKPKQQPCRKANRLIMMSPTG